MGRTLGRVGGEKFLDSRRLTRLSPLHCFITFDSIDQPLVLHPGMNLIIHFFGLFSIESEKTHMAIFPGGFCSFTFPLNIALLVLSCINIKVTTEILCKQSESSCSNLRYDTALEKSVKHEVVVHRLRHHLIMGTDMTYMFRQMTF